MNFYELKIANAQENTKDAVLVEFEIPSHLSEIFRFNAGQHLVFDFNLERNNYHRTYSICSAAHEKKLCISVKRQKKGIISNYINDAFFKGLKISVSQPFGNFYADEQIIDTSTIILWAGGSGITPMMGIAKHILNTFSDKKILLIYANRNEKSIMFEREIEQLKQKYHNLFSDIQILSNHKVADDFFSKIISFHKNKKEWKGQTGYITNEFVTDIANKFPKAVHYVCGPEKLMEICETTLLQNPTQSIHFERFTGASSINNSNKNAVLKVHLQNKEVEIRLEENTLLDAMLVAKLDPPYACKSGTCGSCKAKLVSGEVIMARDFALNEADRAAQKILCCQSWAMSDEVKIEF
jgi:ring-1,2-phenylacetyl-CoA epoxidase subunit PaaE